MSMSALWGIGVFSGLLYTLLYNPTFLAIFLSVLFLYQFSTTYLTIDFKLYTLRKLVNSVSWCAPTDPTAYLVESYRVTKALAYLKHLNDSPESRYTLTHLFAHAYGIAASKITRDIGRIKHGYFQRSDHIGMTIAVDVEKGKDLIPVLIRDVHKETLKGLASKINEIVTMSKAGKNKEHDELINIFNFVPSFIMGALVTVTSYIT